jgi:hypothetical protein
LSRIIENIFRKSQKNGSGEKGKALDPGEMGRVGFGA